MQLFHLELLLLPDTLDVILVRAENIDRGETATEQTAVFHFNSGATTDAYKLYFSFVLQNLKCCYVTYIAFRYILKQMIHIRSASIKVVSYSRLLGMNDQAASLLKK